MTMHLTRNIIDPDDDVAMLQTPETEAQVSPPPHKKQRVTFLDAATPSSSLPPSSFAVEETETDTVERPGAPPLFETLTEELCQTIWYQKEELLAHKERVRHLIMFGQEDEEISKGLEDVSSLGRFTWERSQHKKSAIYYIIAANRESSGDPDYIRKVSRKCTAWARQVATEEGFSIHSQVYGDPLETLLRGDNWEDDLKAYNGCHVVEDTPSDMEEDDVAKVTPIPASREKRKNHPAEQSAISQDSGSEDDTRRVRPRACSITSAISMPVALLS